MVASKFSIAVCTRGRRSHGQGRVVLSLGTKLAISRRSKALQIGELAFRTILWGYGIQRAEFTFRANRGNLSCQIRAVVANWALIALGLNRIRLISTLRALDFTFIADRWCALVTSRARVLELVGVLSLTIVASFTSICRVTWRG